MQKITPNIWFNRNAKEAIDFYMDIFPDSKIISTAYYPTENLADFQKDFAGQVLSIEFEIFGQRFGAINADDTFKVSEAVSFAIACKDQDEIDFYWEKLSDQPENEQCGWCKDKFGLSWQILPENIEELMQKPNAYEIMMNQKKVIIDEYKD